MVHFAFCQNRITNTNVMDLLEKLNGNKTQFESEGYGTPMKWKLWRIRTGQDKQLLFDNATNKEIYTFLLGFESCLEG